jgi:hypothetical protein
MYLKISPRELANHDKGIKPVYVIKHIQLKKHLKLILDKGYRIYPHMYQ